MMGLAEIKQWRINMSTVKVSVFIDSLDWLISEHDRLTSLCDGYRGEIAQLKSLVASLREDLRHTESHAVSALTRARAEGVEAGLKAAAETVYPSVCSYRSAVAQDEEGNGLELSDVIAHGYGDSDIGRAKGELALLSDHIYYCEIMNRGNSEG